MTPALLINKWILLNLSLTFAAKFLTDSMSPISHFSYKSFPFVADTSILLSMVFLANSGLRTPLGYWNWELLRLLLAMMILNLMTYPIKQSYHILVIFQPRRFRYPDFHPLERRSCLADCRELKIKMLRRFSDVYLDHN